MEPDRFEYSPIVDRPKLRWPNDERVAIWVLPNVEHYEYLPRLQNVRNPWPAPRTQTYLDMALGIMVIG